MVAAIVQSAINPDGVTGSATITFGAAPQNGNLLIALCVHYQNNPTAATGWTRDANVNGVTESGVALFYKYAGAGESATQTISGVTNNQYFAAFELSGMSGTWATDRLAVNIGVDLAGALSATTTSFNTAASNVMVFGLFGGSVGTATAQTVPTISAGQTTDQTLARNTAPILGRRESMAAFHKFFAASGSAVQFTATWSSPSQVKEWYILVSMAWTGTTEVTPGQGAVAVSGKAVSTSIGSGPAPAAVASSGQAATAQRVVTPGVAVMALTGPAPAVAGLFTSQAAAAVVFAGLESDVVISQAAAVAIYEYASCATTLCQVWLIDRVDGALFAFTSLDEDVEFLGRTCRSCASLNPTATEAMADLDSVANVELGGIIDDDAISEHDLWAGLYDGARVEVWLVDWTGGDTPRRLALGTCGKLSQGDGFVMEVLGNGAKLQQQAVTEVATPKCKWDFGKGQCPVDVPAITEASAVTGVTSRRAFTASGLIGYVANPMAGGLVTMTGGLNDGFQSEIKDFEPATGGFTLWVPAPYPYAVADTFTAATGCDQLAATCKHYGAYLDFGGYPDVPGDDSMTETPDAKY